MMNQPRHDHRIADSNMIMDNFGDWPFDLGRARLRLLVAKAGCAEKGQGEKDRKCK